MDTDQHGSRGTQAILYSCFFISGVAGLSYEVIWSRYLSLLVGATGTAQVIVLATFMAGLALGSHFLGGGADRVRDPLKYYAYLELAIGVYALFFDRIFIAGRALFIHLAHGDEPQAGALLAGKIIVSVMTVLPPTILMGGTLPAMTRYLVRSPSTTGPILSRLYFLNSIGAVAGCVLAGFYTIRTFGLQATMMLGAAMNIVAGLLAFAVSSRAETGPVQPASQPEAPAARMPGWAFAVLLACVGLSGAVAMMYEVAWIRMLALVLGSSTYAFSLMLATFILGLGIGGLLLSLKKTTSGYALLFGLSSVGVGLTVLLSLPFYVRLPYTFNQVASLLSREPETFPLYQLTQFLLCGLVMIVPTILQGVTLPAAARSLATDIRVLGGRVGLVFAVNTVGTLVGSAFAGFYGLPYLTLKGTLELAVAINAAVGIAALCASGAGRTRVVSLAASALLLCGAWTWYGTSMRHWNDQLLSFGTYRNRERIENAKELELEAATRRTVYYRDGVDATVAVFDLLLENERSMAINGKFDASLVNDLATQKLIGHLPMLAHPNPRNVLVVGIGSGASIASVLAYDVERVDVVELSGEVIDASRHFEAINGRYWDDPRVHVYREDAKTFLQVTERRYDVIISEPSNPWVAGIAGVFSREHFEISRAHLNPGGFCVQWMHAYEMEDPVLFMILETFTSVFPCYTMWNMQRLDVMLLGSPDPYAPDLARMEARAAQPGVQKDLASMGIHSILPLLATQMRDAARQPAHVRWTGAQHSDFFPVLDYAAPRGFFTGTNAASIRLLDERAWSPALSRLWIKDYLAKHTPTAAEFKDVHDFLEKYDTMFVRGRLAWARAWNERYPDDVAAAEHVGEAMGETAERALAYLDRGGPEAGFAIQKLRCRLLLRDYMQERNYLQPLNAEAVLAAVDSVLTRFPGEADSDIYRWRGQLQLDLGNLDAAAENLREALERIKRRPGSAFVRIDCGILLCNALLHAGDRPGAAAAYDEYLRAYESLEFRVPMMRAMIRDGGF